MRTRKQYQPGIEALESMTLLSGGSAGLHGLVASLAPMTPLPSSAGQQIRLNGRLTGTYHVPFSILADVGTVYTISGHGTVRGHGKADVAGSLQSLGYVLTGKAHGSIVLSTPRGSLTLSLTGPTQKGFAKLPERFSFKITNSSGAYLHDRGHGTAVLVLDPASAGADHGSFTLVLVS
jgi:hypothetical protein